MILAISFRLISFDSPSLIDDANFTFNLDMISSVCYELNSLHSLVRETHDSYSYDYIDQSEYSITLSLSTILQSMISKII